MRIRTRTIPESNELVEFSPYSHISPPTLRRYATMTTPSRVTSYEQSSDLPLDRHRNEWNSFEHYQVSENSSPVKVETPIYDAATWSNPPGVLKGICRDSMFGYNADAVGSFGSIGRLNYALPHYVTDSTLDGFVTPPDGLDYLHQRAYKQMMPGIKAELSILNSLLELKDFKTLPATLKNMYQLVKRLASSQSLKQLFSVQENIRASADGYLQLKFNILPTLSDISGIYAALTRTEARINDLLSRAGTPQRRHFAYIWDEHPSVNEATTGNSTGLFYDPNCLQSATYERTVRPEKSVFHAEIEYNYNYTKYQAEHAQLLGLLDAFGVNLNPQIIWNAIPWSFVIDWVIGVSRFLDQFSMANMEPQINIRRYLWSIKRVRRITVTWQLEEATFYGAPIPHSSKVPLPGVIERVYARYVVPPEKSWLIASGLSYSEFSLGAALVFPKRRIRLNRLRSAIKRYL